MIPGVLFTSSKIILGLTKRNIPMKKFISNKGTFMVATKKPLQTNNSYALVKKKDSDVAELVEIIGDVSDYNTELEYIRYTHGIRFKSHRKSVFNLEDITPSRLEIKENIISVDPKGCVDIDDAIHISEKDNHYVVGIHIADVSSYVNHGSDLDQGLKERCETVYFGKRYDMMPHKLVEECSLTQKKWKRAFSAIFHIDKKTLAMRVTFHKTKIMVKKNYSYESAEKQIGKNETITKLYYLGQRLMEKYGKHINKYDIHKMVEVYMIMCNSNVAEFLYNKYKLVPSRVHKSSKITINSSDKNVIERSQVYHMQSAKYTFGETGHFGLQQDHYTHFTSPIRRYFDIIIHRLLYNAITNQESIMLEQKTLDYLNDIHSKIKYAEYEASIVKFAHEQYNKGITCLEETGYIVNIKNYRLMIHLSDLDIDLECHPFSDKVINKINIGSDQNRLIGKMNGKEIILELCQKVKLYIVIVIKEHAIRKKLQIQLIDPDPTLVLGLASI